MKNKELSSKYLSAFCLEMTLLQRAGVSISDGLLMLSEDDDDKHSKAVLEQLHSEVENGKSLSRALEDSGRFPEYMLNMVSLAETAGRLEETMQALSEYYERRARLSASIKNAVLYPVILLVIMLAVVVVLITQVLPIFNDVFSQLGAQMSPLATLLMNFGSALSGASTVIVIVVAALALVFAVIFFVPGLKAGFTKFCTLHFGGTGIAGKAASVRFASAMAISMASGLGAEESIAMAGKVAGGSKKMDAKTAKCMELLAGGARLEEALSGAGIFSGRDSRMLSLGVKTGCGDTVMQEIAERSESSVQNEIDSKLGKIEPTLVIIISVIVGAILLSVMLPLMGIMSTIG